MRCSGQAAYLADPGRLRFLEPFIGRERTAGEAAGELGVSVQQMRYHIGRQLELQLVRQVYERKRAGRAMKVYAGPAGFLVPYALTPFASIGEWLAATYTRITRGRVDSLAELLGKLERPGGRIYCEPGGEIWNEADLANVRIDELLPLVVYDIAASVRLHRRDAQEIATSMRALFAEYKKRQLRDSGDTYPVQLSQIPQADVA